MRTEETTTRRRLLKTTSSALAAATGATLVSEEVSAADDKVVLEDSVYYATRKGFDVEFVSKMEILITEGTTDDDISITDTADAYVNEYSGSHEFTDVTIELDRAAQDFSHRIVDTVTGGNTTQVSFTQFSDYTGNLTVAELVDNYTATVDGDYTYSYEARDSYG